MGERCPKPDCRRLLTNGEKCGCTWRPPEQRHTKTTYLITYPKGQGEDVLIEDPALTLTFTGGWAVFSDDRGPCLAVPSGTATIQRIDEESAPKE